MLHGPVEDPPACCGARRSAGNGPEHAMALAGVTLSDHMHSLRLPSLASRRNYSDLQNLRYILHTSLAPPNGAAHSFATFLLEDFTTDLSNFQTTEPSIIHILQNGLGRTTKDGHGVSPPGELRASCFSTWAWRVANLRRPG